MGGRPGARRASRAAEREGRGFLFRGRRARAALDRLAEEKLRPGAYLGLIETHVEQGPGLWKSGTAAAIVTAIAGRRQYACTLTGETNHAGATRMTDRRDALAGAAQIVTSLETLGRELDREDGQTVLTVGRLDVEPNAVNVIPGRARFSIDVRARSEETLDGADARLREMLGDIAAERGLELQVSCTESIAPVPLDPAVCARLRNAAARLGSTYPTLRAGPCMTRQSSRRFSPPRCSLSRAGTASATTRGSTAGSRTSRAQLGSSQRRCARERAAAPLGSSGFTRGPRGPERDEPGGVRGGLRAAVRRLPVDRRADLGASSVPVARHSPLRAHIDRRAYRGSRAGRPHFRASRPGGPPCPGRQTLPRFPG